MSVEDKIKVLNDKIRINQIKSKLTKNCNKNSFNVSRIKEKYSHDNKISFISPYSHIANKASLQSSNTGQLIQSILYKYKANSDILLKNHQESISIIKPKQPKQKPKLQSQTIIGLDNKMLIESTEAQFPSSEIKKTSTTTSLALEPQNEIVYTVQSHKKESSNTNIFTTENLLTTHENYEIIQTEVKRQRRWTDYALSPSYSSSKEKEERAGTKTSTNNCCIKSVELIDGVCPIKRRIAFVQRERKGIIEKLSPVKNKQGISKDEIFDCIKEYVNQNSSTMKSIKLNKPREIKVPNLIQRTIYIKPH